MKKISDNLTQALGSFKKTVEWIKNLINIWIKTELNIVINKKKL